MRGSNSDKKSVEYQELLEENARLHQEIDEQEVFYRNLFSLLIDITKHLQLSSASIKVAVSSLLSSEIFWDPVNQHEFLETINTSASSISNAIVMLNLAFRVETGNLILEKEPHSLQEILASVQKKILVNLPNLQFTLELSESEQPVIVDYEYLSVGLIYFIFLIHESNNNELIELKAHEEDQIWCLDFYGLNKALIQKIENMQFSKEITNNDQSGYSSSEAALHLYIANKIFQLQNVSTEVIAQKNEHFIRLIIPGS